VNLAAATNNEVGGGCDKRNSKKCKPREITATSTPTLSFTSGRQGRSQEFDLGRDGQITGLIVI